MANMSTPSSDDVTPSVAEFLAREKSDSNLWWRLECGHHQNLFEEAVDEIERLRQGLWDVYAALGFDTDGNATPRHLAYPDLVTLVLDAATQTRADMLADR